MNDKVCVYVCVCVCVCMHVCVCVCSESPCIHLMTDNWWLSTDIKRLLTSFCSHEESLTQTECVCVCVSKAVAVYVWECECPSLGTIITHTHTQQMFIEMNDGADFHLNAEWKLLCCSYREAASLILCVCVCVCVCACVYVCVTNRESEITRAHSFLIVLKLYSFYQIIFFYYYLTERYK